MGGQHSTPLCRVLDALRGQGREPTAVGDRYQARCPVSGHGAGRGDEHPSLAIDAGDDGRVLLHCFAGCPTDAVLAALGLTMADLMASPAGSPSIEDVYGYEDEAGEVLFEVVRYTPKAFKQRRPDGRGGYTWSLKGVRRVPFRLPAVLDAAKHGRPVYVCEGEKDVLAAEAAGLVATCNPGGAGKWAARFSKSLRGATVIVVADRDAPGRKHAQQVASSLEGIAASVTVVEPAEGKDLSDHLAAGKRIDELVPLESQGTNEHAPLRPLTDTGNAERLHDLLSRDMRYCFLWNKWFVWDSTRWRLDDSGRALAASKRVVRHMQEDAATRGDSKLSKWARTCESRGKRGAMLDLLRSEPGIPILPDELDRGAWLLNCVNGTLDLRSGDLRPHCRDDLITKLLPAEYVPDAKCPLWDAFLERVLPTPAVRDFVQRMVGWSLTGDVSAQVLMFCHGLGANGKSTFLRVLLELFGNDYGIQAPTELLLDSSYRGHPTELADLFGVRLVVCVEMGIGRKLDEVLVKQLTGGDIIRARRMREDFWQFVPTHHIWVAANHKPVVVGTDEAIWRRLMLIPFTVTIPEAERDGTLLEKLRSERPGILAWAVRGCQAWQERGVDAPDEVRAATDAYRAEMDVLGVFLEEKCVEGAGASIGATDLYLLYAHWAERRGEEPLTQQQFGQRIAERGFERRKRRGSKVYLGLAGRMDGDQGGPGGPPEGLIDESQGDGSASQSADAASDSRGNGQSGPPSSPRTSDGHEQPQGDGR